MVCPIASGKMAVLARLLVGDGLSQSQTVEKVGDHILFAQDIYGEFREADEPNLLNEEDMHIFGLKPLTDELHLVSCNACKKPIMASQYLAHAEICKILGSSFEGTPASDGPATSKKPSRKERKNSMISTSRKSASIDNGGNTNGPVVAPQNGGYSTCVMPPPMKRPKLIAGDHTSERDDPGMMPGLTSIPAPLASKIYYSQQSNRLRLMLAHSYSTVASEGLSDGWDPGEQFIAIAPKPDPAFGNGSELCPDTSLGCVRSSNVLNHHSDTALRPEDAPSPLVGEKFFPKVYSFAGDSGKSLSVQQPNGSIPVS